MQCQKANCAGYLRASLTSLIGEWCVIVSSHQSTYENPGKAHAWRGEAVMDARSGGHQGFGLRLPITLSLIFLGVGCSQQDTPRSEVVRPVKTMVVVAGDETRIRSFPGRVEGSKSVELAFQVPGLLVQLPVKEGQSVAKNDLIAQLRQDEFQARLQGVQGQLDQAPAALNA